jgi:hypothetical protein
LNYSGKRTFNHFRRNKIVFGQRKYLLIPLKKRKMKKQFTGVLLCIFASIYFFSSCKKVAELVPFTGIYATVTENLSDPPILQLRITGTGHATHLGNGKFIALSTLNLTTPPPFGFGGTATFYGANEDVFYTTFKGTFTPNADGTSTAVMTHSITGGSGRFANATGTFKGYTIVDAKSPLGTITYEGRISY